MLVSVKAVLDLANVKEIAVGAFNITSLEGVQAALRAAEELGQPVILQLAPVHEPVIPLKVIGPITVMMAEESSVPVCVRLDHGDKLEILQEALGTGFTSVMYDGSVLSFGENATNTKIAVEVTGNRDASMETEIGAMGRQEFSNVGEGEEGEAMESCYTDPEQARAFTAFTGIDTLACPFGIVHGLYLTTPKLDFDRIHRIRESIGIPIVTHDGSGVSDKDFKKCITNGVRRISYCTYLAKAGDIYVKEEYANAGEYVFFRDVTQQAVQAMKKDVLRAVKMFPYLE